MKNEKKNKVITGVLLIILVFFLDRITKVLILNIANETGKVDIYLNSFIKYGIEGLVLDCFLSIKKIYII